jgi:NADP-dependent 3-hydroxy acid dehydrogenase YdfG
LIALDITEAQKIERVVQEVVGSVGVDVVFNNAGYGLAGALEGLTDEQIHRMVNTNMLGAIRTTKAFIPYFRQKRAGLFINTTIGWRTTDGSSQLDLSRDEMGA